MRNEIEKYIETKNLKKHVILKGNCSRDEVIKAYQKSHFLVLPSKSEGWPKVLSEAMAYGVGNDWPRPWPAYPSNTCRV